MSIEITGTVYNDVWYATADAETYDGLHGVDTLYYVNANTALIIDLLDATRNTGFAAGDIFFSIERFALSAFADVFYGSDQGEYVNGFTGDDYIYGRAGNDTLTGHSGNDHLYGETGNDGMFGGGGNDQLFGGVGNDILYGDSDDDRLDGGEGNDTLHGGIGNDFLLGGTGDDILNGNAGDDRLVHVVGEGTSAISGGEGFDTLELRISTAAMTKAVEADLLALSDWLAANRDQAGSYEALAASASGQSLALTALGITVTTVEYLDLYIDGALTALEGLMNEAPEAEMATSLTTEEDVAVTGQVVASDADGDVLTYTLVDGPAHGTLVLDEASGAYTYTPEADFSGADEFAIAVADPSGATVTQVVSVDVTPVADAPELTAGYDMAFVVADGTALPTGAIAGSSGNDTLVGTAGSDRIYGDAASTARIGLDITAALADLDGSEVLSVTLSGVPDGATLSAGTMNADGSYTLAPADLENLTLEVDNAAPFDLVVTATATEADGTSASTSQVLNIGGSGNGAANGQGNDRISGGAGNDYLDGQTGDDIIAGGAGNDVIVGGDGSDTIDFSDASVGVVVSMSFQVAIGDGIDQFYEIENILGSDFGDVLSGDDDANVIDGGAGGDNIYGNGGDDIIMAGSGNDRYDGGTGFDTIDFSGVTSRVRVDLLTGRAEGAGSDRLLNFEAVIGSAQADELTGSNAGDALSGGAGDDIILGGKGSDILTGGAGDDTFLFENRDLDRNVTDIVTDFETGDVLDFSGLASNGRGRSGFDIEVTDTADGALVTLDFGGRNQTYDVVLLQGVSASDLATGSDSLWLIG